MANPHLPALQQRIGPPTALSTTQDMCRRLQQLDEDSAWALLNMVVQQAAQSQMTSAEKKDSICKQLEVVARCRVWSRRAGDLEQLRRRWNCSFPAITVGQRQPSAVPGTRSATYYGSVSSTPSGSSAFPGTPPNGSGSGSNGSGGNGNGNGNGKPNGKPTPPCSTDCGGPGNCGCGPCVEKDHQMYDQSCPMPTPQPIGSPVDWKSGCGGYRMPDPTNAGLYTKCDAAACIGGMRVGLERIPFNRLLVPGVLQTISMGFTRSSRLVALTFTRQQRPTATLNYNPDDIIVNNWRTSSIAQPYDFWRVSTTFGGVDPNTIPIPLYNYFEDGANALSAILNAMNFIPTIIPPTEIGNNEGLVQFDITLDAAAPANQTVFGWAWVLFLGNRNGA